MRDLYRRVTALLLAFVLLFGNSVYAAGTYGEYGYTARKKEIDKIVQANELVARNYQTYTRSALPSLTEITEPLYNLGLSGWYYSMKIKDDGVVTLMLTGDLMCQSRQQTAAMSTYSEYNFNDSFSYVRSLLKSADLAVGNLETTLSESVSYMSEEYQVDGTYHCNAPSTYLDALRYAGFDLTVTANNHNMDAGIRGLFQTYYHLDQYGLIHTGTFISDDEPRYVMVRIHGINIAFLSYSMTYNGLYNNWTYKARYNYLNLYKEDKLQRDVKAAKAAGADYIIAYNHWGKEYEQESNEKQQMIAQQMADAGVDYIVGSHPHALQEYDVLTAKDGRKVPVMYSLGNFISHQTKDMNKDTAILQIRLVKNSAGKAVLKDDGYYPCRVQKTYKSKNYVVVPLGSKCPSTMTSTFKASYARTKAVIGDKLKCLS